MKQFVMSGLLMGCISMSFAASVTVPMYLTSDGKEPTRYVGTITATDSQYGLLLSPKLNQLSPGISPGIHGFHVHINPSCADDGMAAGGHLDPLHTNQHLGPYNPKGHLGDLPALYVNAQGSADLPILAPRLTVKDILNHSLMIHAGADNYSDKPEKLGGGGARMVCGVIPATASS